MSRCLPRIAVVSLTWVMAATGAALVSAQASASAQSASADKPATDVTFTRHIAPILQRSCQRCHRPDGGAPMPLITYEQVRPWARSIKTRTGLGQIGRASCRERV